MKNFTKEKKTIHLGIDVGSTTTKVVAINVENNQIIYYDYKRHNADQIQSVIDGLKCFYQEIKEKEIGIIFTGSGAKPIADYLNVPFTQEVVANSIALKKLYKNVGTAIELGGQDAKIIFFHKNEETKNLDVSDMRMNGSCAGGTGAFIDEVATILKVPVEQFDHLAESGTSIYDVSGRCGVYAKTDIQPLLNQGVAKDNIALSTFHAIAK